MKLKTKMKKKIEKELLLMVRKLLLQVLIGWAKPLYTSLVASTPALHTAAAKICTFFSLYYILACVVLYLDIISKCFSAKFSKQTTDCSVYFLEEEPTTPAPLRFATSLTLRPPLLLRTI